MNYMALKSWESKWKIHCNLVIRKIRWFFSQSWFMLINPCSIILSSEHTNNHVFFFYLITNFDTYFWAWIYRSLLFWDTWLELHIIGLDPTNYMPTSRKSGGHPQIRFLLEHDVKKGFESAIIHKKVSGQLGYRNHVIFCFGLIRPFSFTFYLPLKFFTPIHIT